MCPKTANRVMTSRIAAALGAVDGSMAIWRSDTAVGNGVARDMDDIEMPSRYEV